MTFLSLPPWAVFAVQVAITIWMLTVAVLDHRTGRIPNWLTAPVIFGVGALRMVQALQGDWAKLGMLLAWAVIFGLWMLHFIGGGDAKFLMGEPRKFQILLDGLRKGGDFAQLFPQTYGGTPAQAAAVWLRNPPKASPKRPATKKG